MSSVKIGEEYDVKIVDRSTNNRGIAIVNNRIVFIPDTKIGDEVKIKISKVFSYFAVAEKIDPQKPEEGHLIKTPDEFLQEIREKEKPAEETREREVYESEGGDVNWQEYYEELDDGE